jgi:hypothetical protein
LSRKQPRPDNAPIAGVVPMYTQFKPPSPHAPVTVPRQRELKAHGQ